MSNRKDPRFRRNGSCDTSSRRASRFARSVAALVLVASCGGGEAARVPDKVAESLPRQTRVLLRDAEQEVIIAQADLDDQQRQEAVRARDLDDARGARARGDRREAEIALCEARLTVATGDVDQARARLDLARARRDQTHAEVLLRYELSSSDSANLPERRKRVKDLVAEMDQRIAEGRKLRAELDRIARRRDELLDRDLAKTAGRAGPPWTD